MSGYTFTGWQTILESIMIVNKTHFNAILHKKPDIITGKMVWCWNIHKKTEGLLDGDLKDYFISDIGYA